jgi:hypothetical protein
MAEQMVGNSVGTMVEKKVCPMVAMMAECLVVRWDARMVALMVE